MLMVVIYLASVNRLQLCSLESMCSAPSQYNVITFPNDPPVATVAWLHEILEISMAVGFGTLSYIHVHIRHSISQY
jgi:hypothetical protein